MKWMKSISKTIFLKTAISCALACVLSLSGCGAGTPDQDTEKEINGADSAQPTLSPLPATAKEWEDYYNAPMPEQIIPEGRETVTLGTIGYVRASSQMYQAVNAFNQAQEKYFVSIEIYDDYDRFLIDIATKKGTDLYDLYKGVRVDPLIEKGVLEDLTPYFEGSAVAGREDMVDAVWRARSAEDKQAILRVIDNSYRTTFGSDFVPNSVIYEEAEPFFQGQKSVEDVAKIIQNRIALYLAEGF